MNLEHSSVEKLPKMSHPLCKLIGYELSHITNGEKFRTVELAKSCQVIGLLFTADDTTEESSKELGELRASLIQLYKAVEKRNGNSYLKILLVPTTQQHSSRYDEGRKIGVKQFFMHCECPILTIATEKAIKIQEYLTRKYEVQQTPTLILINVADAEVIIYDGLEKMSKDPKGVQFPWKYQPNSDILNSMKVIKNSCEEKSQEESKVIEKVEVVPEQWRSAIKGILFAAFWCPPCRSFVTLLNEFYERVNKEGKKFEVIFVSSDRSQDSFERFFSTMPWLGVRYEDEKLRNQLMKAMNVKAIPNLTILDANDQIITRDGRLELNEDIEGIEFPWYPRIVDELRDRHTATVNHSLCVIYFTDDSEADYDKGELIFTPIATEIEMSDVEDAFKPKFFIASDSDLAESLRVFVDLDETKSYLVIMDIANFRYAVKNPSPDEGITETFVKEFLHDFQSNKLTYKYIHTRFI